MKQLSLIPETQASKRKEHGGSLLLGRRRRRRPLSLSAPLHLVLRSDFALGPRSLLRHRPLIEKVIFKAQRRFRIRVYEKAIVSNHIHLLVKGYRREDIQNFFRVVAGHIAQAILKEFPIRKSELERNSGGAPKVLASGKKSSWPGGAPERTEKVRPLREKENKFWQTRIYSRVMSWGREYRAVKKYVVQNALEALGLIAYQPRRMRGGRCPREVAGRGQSNGVKKGFGVASHLHDQPGWEDSS